MSKEANVTAIGAFVVVGVSLLVVSVIVLGSGKFFRESNKYVAYFNGSVKGLQDGAPVKFRGVDVGIVTDIDLLYRNSDGQLFIPVTIEILSKKAIVIDGEGRLVDRVSKVDRDESFQNLIDKHGMRAKLAMQSFVTGQLFVQLDLMPEEPQRLIGLQSGLPEIPTVPSSFEKISQTIEKIPFEEMAEKFMAVLDGLENLTNSHEVLETLRTLSKFLEEADALVQSLQSSVPGFKSDLDTLSTEADKSLKQVRRTLQRYENFIADGSPVEYEVRATLNEVRAAAKSLRVFADFIERHPEALLKGKN